MSLNKMPALRIGALEAGVPIVQGAMGVGISLSDLASAVANAGGIGVIATPGIGQFEPDWDTDAKAANTRALRREIRKAKAKTSGLIGVNVMVALSDFDELIQYLKEYYGGSAPDGWVHDIENMEDKQTISNIIVENEE